MPIRLQLVLPECMCRIELETTKLSVISKKKKKKNPLAINLEIDFLRSRIFLIKMWQKQSTSANKKLRDGG